MMGQVVLASEHEMELTDIDRAAYALAKAQVGFDPFGGWDALDRKEKMKLVRTAREEIMAKAKP